MTVNIGECSLPYLRYILYTNPRELDALPINELSIQKIKYLLEFSIDAYIHAPYQLKCNIDLIICALRKERKIGIPAEIILHKHNLITIYQNVSNCHISIPEKFRSDRDVCLAAVKSYGFNYIKISKNLKLDDEILFAAASNDGRVLLALYKTVGQRPISISRKLMQASIQSAPHIFHPHCAPCYDEDLILEALCITKQLPHDLDSLIAILRAVAPELYYSPNFISRLEDLVDDRITKAAIISRFRLSTYILTDLLKIILPKIKFIKKNKDIYYDSKDAVSTSGKLYT